MLHRHRMRDFQHKPCPYNLHRTEKRRITPGKSPNRIIQVSEPGPDSAIKRTCANTMAQSGAR
jgi:hypothetical protein